MDTISLAVICLTLVALAAIGTGSHSTARSALDVFKTAVSSKARKSK